MPQKPQFAWPEAPIFLGAAVMFLAGALLIANLLVIQLRHGKPMKLCPDLMGAVNPPVVVPLRLGTLLDDTYEQAAAKRIGAFEPLFPFAVRLRNQVEFSVLGVLPVAQVIYGNDGEMLDPGYVAGYCNRSIAAFMKTAPAWAASIATMQAYAQARGQTFLYVITPAKPATYPQFIPAGTACAATAADRTELVPDWDALLQSQAVRLVDTTRVVQRAKGDYPFALFPRGGIHWDQVASTLGAQAIMAGLEAQRHDGAFTPPGFTWEISSEVTGMDADLAQLMNLFFLPPRLQAPHVTLREAPAKPGCRRLHVTIVGGSFMEAVGAVLSQQPCVAQVVEYFYWHTNRFTWTNGVMTHQAYGGPIDAGRRAADLADADVLIYEENELLLAPTPPPHGRAFLQWIEAQPGAGKGG